VYIKYHPKEGEEKRINERKTKVSEIFMAF
jgi:hypothetical protein